MNIRTKYIIYFALVFSLLIGSSWKIDTHGASSANWVNQQDTFTNQSLVQGMIDQVNQERILTDLHRLTGVEPICTSHGCTSIYSRETGTEDLQSAKDYIYETLKNLHYSMEVLDWKNGGYSDQNILAHKHGMIYPDEEIYFIAHLDGYLDDNTAADDNASGVANLLELARILSTRQLCRSVTIFFSTGEEHGSLGSYGFVNDYAERLENIIYLIDIDMVGYDSNDDGKIELWNGNDPFDFVQLLSNIISYYGIGLDPEIISGCG